MKQIQSLITIKTKLIAAFISILLLSVLPLVPAVLIATKTVNEKVQLLINRIENQELQIKDFIYERYKEKDFQETGNSIALTKFRTKQEEAKQVLISLDAQKLTVNERMVIDKISNTSKEINLYVDSLSLLLKKRGFKDYGLEGSLRRAIHEVENGGYQLDMASLLMLRRNEKDFFLRKDIKYINEFEKNFENFRNETIEKNAQVAHVISSKLDSYKKELEEVVAIEKKIGLKSNEGLQGKINASFNLIWPQVEWLSESIRDNNQQQIDKLNFIMKVLFAIQLILGVLLGIFYSQLIARPVNQIKNAIEELANGVFPNKLKEGNNDELGKSKMALNQFLERLKTSIVFAQELGDGNLKANYKEEFSNDVMAKSLLTMQQKLNETEIKQTEINWAIQGIAAFGEITKNESKELAILGQEMISMIVPYLSAQQGALFIFQNEKICRFATYACEEAATTERCFKIGEGYVGQCFKDNESIILDNAPNGFTKISSGLGFSKPVTIILVPIRTNKEVMGVLELSSFQPIKHFQRDFLEKIAERIAITICNKRNSSSLPVNYITTSLN